jgi:hypothetical protein
MQFFQMVELVVVEVVVVELLVVMRQLQEL